MLSVFFFGNPLVSGLVLESEALKMQATSFLAFMTMLHYFIPIRLAKMKAHDTLMFCQRQDIGTSNHTYHSFWWERQIIQSMFSYISETNYPQTWWLKTIISHAPSDPRVEVQSGQLVSVPPSEAAAGRLWGSELESSEDSLTHMFLNGSCCLIP